MFSYFKTNYCQLKLPFHTFITLLQRLVKTVAKLLSHSLNKKTLLYRHVMTIFRITDSLYQNWIRVAHPHRLDIFSPVFDIKIQIKFCFINFPCLFLVFCTLFIYLLLFNQRHFFHRFLWNNILSYWMEEYHVCVVLPPLFSNSNTKSLSISCKFVSITQYKYQSFHRMITFQKHLF